MCNNFENNEKQATHKQNLYLYVSCYYKLF